MRESVFGKQMETTDELAARAEAEEARRVDAIARRRERGETNITERAAHLQFSDADTIEQQRRSVAAELQEDGRMQDEKDLISAELARKNAVRASEASKEQLEGTVQGITRVEEDRLRSNEEIIGERVKDVAMDQQSTREGSEQAPSEGQERFAA